MNVNAQVAAPPGGGSKLDNRRVIAGLIDLAVVLAGVLGIGVAAGLTGFAQSTSLGLSAVMTGWVLYYYFAFESGAGQTLGKRLMKIRVVRVDGSPAGMREVAVRTVLRLIDGLFLYLVGLIVMLVSGERRGRLGDLAAGTMIVPADAAQTTQTTPAVAAPAATAPRITMPSPEPEPEPASEELKELARDVAAEPDARAEPEPELEVKPFVAPPHPPEAEAVVVNSVETVSAIDLVMEEEEPKEPA